MDSTDTSTDELDVPTDEEDILSQSEPNFSEDVDEMEVVVRTALNELTNVKAYTLQPTELQAFKIAQYSLRVIDSDRDTKMNKKKLREMLKHLD